MEKTFIYKEKVSYYNFLPALVFFIIAGLCWYFGYGIAFKNLRLLAYPNSLYVTAVIGLLFLVSAVMKLNKANKANKNPNPIVFGETLLNFPHKGKNMEVIYAEIENVGMREDEDDGNYVTLTANGEKYDFFEEYFENKNKFDEFVELIKTKTKK